MRKVILITGASSGFGELTAYQLADAGHLVYASMRGVAAHNAHKAAKAKDYARSEGVDIRALELDVQDQASVDAAVDTVIREHGRLDVLIHNAGHMTYGPAEAFTPEQYAELYDVNVIGTQRLNRAALPHMRRAGAQPGGEPLVVWVGSTSTRGGSPPLLGPYFAAKAAMDSLAVTYAGELSRWGIETVIAVPGIYTKGTAHFAHATYPADKAREGEYAAGPTKDLAQQVQAGHEGSEPAGMDAADVGRAIVDVINLPFGTRPLRVTIDPADDGAEQINALGDWVRAEYLKTAGMGDLLHPAASH